MNMTAMGWLAYDLSNSAFIVGLVVFVGQISLMFSPITGVWGDRLDRRRVIVVVQTLCLLNSSALAVVTLTHQVTVSWLIGLAIVRGLINAVEFPTRQSFIVELVANKADLSNAIGLGASLFNIARLVGPFVAGAVIVVGGPGLCFLLDAVSFLPVMAGLLMMRMVPRPARLVVTHPWQDLRAGWRYVVASSGLRAPLLMVPMIALAGFCSGTLAPVFARDVFHGDARTLGQILGAVGGGALLGALYLSSRTSIEGLPNWITRGAVLAGLGQGIFAVSPWFGLALAGLVASGIGAVLAMAGCNTMIQSLVDDDKRSRVMGVFTMGQGMFPIGSLLVGWIASVAGARLAMGCAAIGCLAAAFVFNYNIIRERPTGTRPA